jgi:L-amino acid N-acyltransferase YncA
METVPAVWEQRNLGVSTVEVTAAAEDTAEDLGVTLANLTEQYQVVKVPAGNAAMMRLLEQQGFSFIETSMGVEHALKPPEIPPILRRLADGITVRSVPPEDLTEVTDRLHSGMFDTDRVYLDPHFTAEQAAVRYSNWIGDEVARGAAVYEVVYNNDPIGFYIFREGARRTGLSALSGLYDKVNTPGMGLVLLFLIIEEARTRHLARITSHISSNNPAVVNTHVALGFKIVRLHYVYVRHR